MRDAPPVTLPAGRSPLARRLWTGLPLGLLLVGLALTGLWAWQAPGWRPWAGLAAWLAYGVLAWRWRRPPAGRLAWDGEAWFWRGQGEAGADWPVLPEVALDLQFALLLRLQPSDPQDRMRRWLWLTPEGDPGRWRALRRALYSRRSRLAQ